MSDGVEDFFLVRREVNVGSLIREKVLHEVRELVKGGLVEFLKLFLPLRKEERETDGGVVEVFG